MFSVKRETGTANENEKRDNDPSSPAAELVVKEDGPELIPTRNGNGVRCAVYLHEFW